MNGTNTGAGATGWGTPTFDDEFNGTSVNTNNWNVEGPRAPNNGQEEDCYSPTTVSESGGDLNIALLNQSCTIGSTTYKYTGGQIDTNDHFNPTYGYFEARMYTPGSNGQISNWPAWWMFGPNWPSGSEIDTFEGFHGYAGWHFCFPDPTACDWQGNYQSTQDFTGWHTYAVDWQPTSIIYYYDGVKVGTLTTGASTANQPMQLVIDNTTGPLDNQAGPLVVPATIKVDYVRAWK
jgi:beta-glucanase (GH16 family)